MPVKSNCEINADSTRKIFNICSLLWVVDETRTDMEYNCFGCIEQLQRLN